MSLFEPLFSALNGSGVRYVVVGGLAAVLHGHARLTADVDLIIDLAPEASKSAMEALTRMGLRPRAPVDPLDFAKPECRRAWIEDKGMRVFSLYDPASPMLEVDLFVDSPIDFESLWRDSVVMSLGAVSVHVVSIADLIRLKKQAGRPQDLLDIEALEEILRRKSGADD